MLAAPPLFPDTQLDPQVWRAAPPEDHPAPEQLERFMHGALAAGEVSFVVRHLMRDCAQCRQVTAGLWKKMERLGF